MKARAGIDEAGFGPMFGPLCIGYSVFEVPDGVGCLRSALRGTCGGRGRGGDPRVPVRDSKLLHQGPH
ncbi:MAG TPA: hypothetical protein VKE69_09875, partial [Planctomycetota bacterium]|nr:hypothetical protein [Planctomycetota bacterium]